MTDDTRTEAAIATDDGLRQISEYVEGARWFGGKGREMRVHDADREREAQAIILRLVLTERPSELRIEAVMARIGEPHLAARAIPALVEAGLLLKIDEYVLATTAAVDFHELRLAA